MHVIKIGAAWCPECIIMQPRWAEIESMQEFNWLENEFYDLDQHAEEVEKMAAKYDVDIQTVPIFIFVSKDDEKLLELHGEISESDLKKHLTELKEK